ncbi:MAG: ComEC/Rec2 family competence protein [Bacillota bacterium]|nr:ComEC/Rec2 family competence protein [Bacillota bacterium]
MAIIMLSDQLIRKETDIYTTISFAAILLLLYNPYTLFDIGFKLSFCTTLSHVLFYKILRTSRLKQASLSLNKSTCSSVILCQRSIS